MASTADRPSASPSGSSAASKSTAAMPKGTARGRSGPDGDTSEQPPQNNQNNVPNLSLAPRISPPVSAPASAATSTFSSREPSPVRLTPRASNSNLTSSARASRSHKSSTSPSPNRGAANAGPAVTTVSSATVLQTAFSQLSKPDLQQPAPVDPSLDVPGPDKTNMPPPPRRTSDSGSASRAPTPASRRRTSMTRGTSRSPASTSRRLEQQQQQQESAPANISTKRSSLAPPPDESVTSPTKANADDSETSLRRGPARTASGGGQTLETVEEASLPSTPMTDKTTKSQPEEAPLPKIEEATKQTVESGSESGGNKSSGSKEENRPKAAATTRPPGDVLPKRSFTSLNSARKPGDGSVRNMIVETETVTSIPQVSLGVGGGDRGSSRNDQGGTVRMKPSMETIRPKKEKKKSTRKPTGNASSKADIFEAKVASAVDEADVSDSDETFVYESNPPDPHPGRQYRYHSRTPSTTSMASQADQFVGRSRSGLRDGHGVTGKRSMKFTNNHNNLDGDGGDLEPGRGSGRVDSNGHSSRHHHFGRHGRGGAAYPSLFDSDSPFPQGQSQAPRSSRHYFSNGFRQNRRANNLRAYQNYRTIGSPKNLGDAYADDFDGDGADDERTPLVGSGRGLRSRNGRRPNSASLRQMEYLEQRHRHCFSRYGGCIIAAFLVFLLIGGAATLLVALTKPLLDVRVTKISNVLASEQEIMLDLNVNAINPNIFPIAVGSMDVNLFARSRYVGSEKFWRDHGPHPDHFPRVERSRQRAELAQMVRRAMSGLAEPQPPPEVQATDGVDRGTDPMPEDPSGDAQTMLLGRVFEFDSPLIFDPSPWARLPSSSVGAIRLARPGNKTEEGGTERWERVLQHPFELIVRGVVKYSLPLSSSMRSASINSKVQVSPDKDGDGDDDSPRNDTVHINRRPIVAGTPERMFSA